MTVDSDDYERIAAALSYIAVALTQRLHPDIAAEGLYPLSSWPASWTWSAAPTWQENLARARQLLDAELDAPTVVRATDN